MLRLTPLTSTIQSGSGWLWAYAKLIECFFKLDVVWRFLVSLEGKLYMKKFGQTRNIMTKQKIQ